MASDPENWPPFAVADWTDTYATLHMWMQIVGKIRLALSPPVNHWWHVALYVTARGVTTSPMPYHGASFEMAFDFIDHNLEITTSDGRRSVLPLTAESVASFYARVMSELRRLDITVRIWPMPQEIPDPIRFDRDETHASYDREYANRFWRILRSVDDVFKEFRGGFLGKSSPVHLFWGGLDLAVTRFNGKRTDAKANADAMNREAYSHEVISAGFWPGKAGALEPSFYAYAVPEPAGFKEARVGPPAAYYSADWGEFFVPYDSVRTASSPRAALMEFLTTTYAAAANLAGWNRQELERQRPRPERGASGAERERAPAGVREP
jgi:hypothetical protein